MENVKLANIELLKRVITDLIENDDHVRWVTWSQGEQPVSFAKDTNNLKSIKGDDFSPLGVDRLFVLGKDSDTLGRFYFDLYNPKGIFGVSLSSYGWKPENEVLKNTPRVVHNVDKFLGYPRGDDKHLWLEGKSITELAESDGDYKVSKRLWFENDSGIVETLLLGISHNTKDDKSTACYITIDAVAGIRVNGCDGLRGSDKVVLPHTIGDRDDNGIWALEREQDEFIESRLSDKPSKQTVEEEEESDNVKLLRNIVESISINSSVTWSNEQIPQGDMRTIAENGKVTWDFIPDFYFHKSGWDVFTVRNDMDRVIETKETVAPVKFVFDVHSDDQPVVAFCSSPQFKVSHPAFTDAPRMDLALSLPAQIQDAVREIENAIVEAGFEEWDVMPCAYPADLKRNTASAAHVIIRISGRIMGVVSVDLRKGVWLRNNHIHAAERFVEPFKKAIPGINNEFMTDEKFDALLHTGLGYSMMKDISDFMLDNKPQSELSTILAFLSQFDDRVNYVTLHSGRPKEAKQNVQVKTLDGDKRKVNEFEEFHFSESGLTKITVHDFTSVTLGTILFSTNLELGIGVVGISTKNDWEPECPDLRDAPRIVTDRTYADYALRNGTRAFVSAIEERGGKAVPTFLAKVVGHGKERVVEDRISSVILQVYWGEYFIPAGIVTLDQTNGFSGYNVMPSPEHSDYYKGVIAPTLRELHSTFFNDGLNPAIIPEDKDARVNLLRDIVRYFSNVPGVKSLKSLKWLNGGENGYILSTDKNNLEKTLNFIQSDKFSSYGYDMFSCEPDGKALSFAITRDGYLVDADVAPRCFLDSFPKENDVYDAIIHSVEAKRLGKAEGVPVDTMGFISSYFSSLLSQGFSVYAIKGAKRIYNISSNSNWYLSGDPDQNFSVSIGSPFTFVIRLNSHVMGAIQLTSKGVLSLVNNHWSGSKFNIREWIKQANEAILINASKDQEPSKTSDFTGVDQIPEYATKVVSSIMKLWEDRRYPDKINHAYETALLISAVTQGEYGKASSVISGAYKLWAENMHVSRFEVKHPALGDRHPMVKRSMRESDFSDYAPSVYNFTNNLLSVIALSL